MSNNAFSLDASRIDSDWDDFDALQADMRAFAMSHPEHEFILADDPGANHTPPRVPRLGWVAFLRCTSPAPEGFDEQVKDWTIPLSKLKARVANDKNLKLVLQSSAGRIAHLKALTARPTVPYR